jgi:hypothetical protein
VISGFRRDVNEICALCGILKGVDLSLLTDVSGQNIGPLFKGLGQLELEAPTFQKNYHMNIVRL